MEQGRLTAWRGLSVDDGAAKVETTFKTCRVATQRGNHDLARPTREDLFAVKIDILDQPVVTVL